MQKINFGIVHLSVVPCRIEPSHKSEQITQLLFGEHFKVLRNENDWYFIRNHYDDYECWIDGNQFIPLSEEEYNEISTKPIATVLDLIQNIQAENSKFKQLISLGSNLPLFDNGNFKIQQNIYHFNGNNSIQNAISNLDDQLIAISETLLNTPYQWGGKSPLGIDCSGFTQLVFKCVGIKLPRDAYQQADYGLTLGFITEARPGDLVFFDNAEGRITHVGIVCQNQQIIHASGYVKIDKLDHQGIYDEAKGKYTHKLRLIKRVI